jgi:hypothetical protein
MKKQVELKDNAGNKYRVIRYHGGWAVLVTSRDGRYLEDPRALAPFKTKRVAAEMAAAMVEKSNRGGGR